MTETASNNPDQQFLQTHVDLFITSFGESPIVSCFYKTFYECRLLWIYNQRKDINLLVSFSLPAEPYRKAVTMDKGIIS